MLALLVLSIFLCCVNVNGGQDDTLQVQGPYILPDYPSLAWRAWVTGSFEVEVHTLDGTVKQIKVLSRQTNSNSGTRRDETALSNIFTQAIEDAVKSWKFRQMPSSIFRLTVVFQLVDTYLNQPSNTHDYTIYRVDEGVFRPPTRITIEAHRQGIKF